MVTKYAFCLLAIASVAFAQGCTNPQVEASSFTSLDATVVTHIAYITEFTLKCDNPLPENYALYAEVDGKPLTAARVGENRYQVSSNLLVVFFTFLSRFIVVSSASDAGKYFLCPSELMCYVRGLSFSVESYEIVS